MKTLFLSLALMLGAIYAHAAILRCNNNPLCAGPNVYANPQLAHDAANAGDTIHIESSYVETYGNLILSKKLTVISTGAFLTQNPNQQQNTYESLIQSITCNPGSEFSVISCKVWFIHILTNNIEVNQSIVENSIRFGSETVSANPSNIVIKRSFVAEIWGNGLFGNYGYSPNLLLQNSKISSFIGIENHSTITANYCIFFGSISFDNSIVNNCIVLQDMNLNYSYANNNVCGGNITGNPGGIGNNANTDMNFVFQIFPPSPADDFQLNPNYGLQDIGIYAGSDPYIKGCQASIPAIYQLSIPNQISNSNLQIQVSTKSN